MLAPEVSALKAPAAHVVQARDVEAEASPEYQPELQPVHTAEVDAVATLLYLPVGQARQALAPVVSPL